MSNSKCYAVALLVALSSISNCSVNGLASGGVATVTLGKTQSGRQTSPRVETVDLGQDKLVSIFVPHDDNGLRRRPKLSKKKKCANLAMARFIAHSKIIDGHDVMELGCGLGLISAAATKHARPSHVALTDVDATLLAKAYSSCTQLNRSKASVSRCVMDWGDRSTWPNQNYGKVVEGLPRKNNFTFINGSSHCHCRIFYYIYFFIKKMFCWLRTSSVTEIQ